MASKNTSIALGQELADYARSKVESGKFGSVSEVVRDALRRAEEQDVRVEALRQAIQEGIDSGPPVPWDFETFRREMRASYKGAA
jgi:antitoxin ParD1/3/4